MAAAMIYPPLGARGGWLHTEWTTQIAVAVVFFVQGLQLPSNDLREGLMAWKLHLFCQSWVFLLVPGIAIGLGYPLRQWIPEELHIGLLYLAVLPTTIATSAAFTAQAKGNTAGILFNICFANFLGLFLAPTVLAWLLAAKSNVAPALGPMFLKIILLLLVPFLIGQLCRFKVWEWAKKKKAFLSQLTTWMIFYIVYAAICNFREQPPETGGHLSLWAAMGWTVGLLIVVQVLCALHLRFLRWPLTWKSAAFFCATQKSMAGGLPIAGTVMAGFTSGPPLAIVVLPLMIYQISQMIIGALLIPFFTPRDELSERS